MVPTTAGAAKSFRLAIQSGILRWGLCFFAVVTVTQEMTATLRLALLHIKLMLRQQAI